MGRRDEPELEELSKLLRRLETMEVAPKQSHPHKPEPEPEPQAEYVGALRGGNTQIKYPEPGHSSSFDAPRTRAAADDQRSAPASSKAIIIGAATAAVVSSIVAAAVVVMTTGNKRSEDASRLTFLALKDRVGTGGMASTNTNAPPADAQRLLQRADTYLRTGKPDDARLVLEQAARAGSGVAALTLGAMYDPARVAQFANIGVKADPTVARAWYERAKDLGVAEANDRLAELAAR